MYITEDQQNLFKNFNYCYMQQPCYVFHFSTLTPWILFIS